MSRKGRPKKEGKRYACGKLQPQFSDPSEGVLRDRRAILGRGVTGADSAAAENPLDTMGARGWLPMSLVRAGHAYAELYRQCGHYARRVTAAIEEAPESAAVDKRRIVDMTHDEIIAIWRVVEKRGVILKSGNPSDPSEGEIEQTRKLQRLWFVMGPEVCNELNRVCIAQSWPMWTMQFVARGVGPEENGHLIHTCPPRWMQSRETLIEGLSIVRDVLRPIGGGREACSERDHPFLGPTYEEVVEYVDEDGAPDPVRTRSGREVEVVRRRRA